MKTPRSGKRTTRREGKRPKLARRSKRRRSAVGVAHRVSATDAARTFSDLLNRVQYRGERFIVERGGAPVCEMTPARPVRFMLSDLAELLQAAPKPDAGYWNSLKRILRDQSQVGPSPWES